MAPLAGARERRGRDWITHSARIEAEIFELRSPVRVGITQALDVDAAREAAFNRCLDELGSKERERERQIDLTHRALFESTSRDQLLDGRYDLETARRR